MFHDLPSFLYKRCHSIYSLRHLTIFKIQVHAFFAFPLFLFTARSLSQGPISDAPLCPVVLPLISQAPLSYHSCSLVSQVRRWRVEEGKRRGQGD